MNQNVTKVAVARLDELPERMGKTVQIGDQELAVYKLSSGQVMAIANRCPHKGGVLSEGIVSGDSVFCPMHDWKINLKNGLVQAPDKGCVQTFDILIEKNEVYVII